jgi:hypothetical protein
MLSSVRLIDKKLFIKGNSYRAVSLFLAQKVMIQHSENFWERSISASTTLSSPKGSPIGEKKVMKCMYFRTILQIFR